MQNNRYIVAFKRLLSQLDDIKNENRTNKLFLLIHSAYCYLRYGATPNDYIHYEFYKLRHSERKKYITHRKTLKLEKKFNDPENAHYFNNKVEFNQKFKDFVKRDWIYIPCSNYEEFSMIVKKHKRVIIKPIDLSSGRGIEMFEYSHEDEIKEKFNSIKNKKVLVEEVAVNCKEIAQFNSSSCNTIRIYTLVEKDGSVSIINSLIRIGAKGSPVDNYHSGGVGAAINVNTGIIYTLLHDVKGKKHVLHPTTGAEIIGKKIPRWDDLIKNVKKAAKVLPTSRWIAWDICITESGFEYIEGNYNGDPGFLQAVDHVGKYYIVKSKI